MAVNKVIADNEVKLDLTGDTVTAADMKAGVTAHDKSGEEITGSIETYAGSTSITPATSPQTLPTAGKYMSSDISVAAVQAGLEGAQYELLLTMGGWYTDGSYRAQQVTKDSSGAALSALKASYAISPDVDCSLSGTDAEGDAAIVAGWAMVHMAETGAGKITFKCCGDAPEVNIPVILRVFE